MRGEPAVPSSVLIGAVEKVVTSRNRRELVPALRRSATGLRVTLITIVSAVATFAVVAWGRVPLLVGLGATGIASWWLLPNRSRRYLARRLGRLAASIAVAMTIVWILAYHLPYMPDIHFAGETGGPSPAGAPLQPPPDGFDLVGVTRAYGAWLGDLAGGDLGDTQYSETVTEGIGRTIPISMQLVLYSQIIAALVAVPGALIGARLRGRKADVGFRTVSLFGLSTPVYVTGLLLVFFFSIGELSVFGVDVGFRLFPSGRYEPLGAGIGAHLRTMALPTVTLGFSTAAIYLVLLRSEIIQQLTLEHVELARAKGLPDRRIIQAHALRPAAPSVVAAIAAQSSALMGSVIIVERIFLLPGFGDYIIVAIIRNDIPAIVGALLVATSILAFINLFADALLLALDPRIA